MDQVLADRGTIAGQVLADHGTTMDQALADHGITTAQTSALPGVITGVIIKDQISVRLVMAAVGAGKSTKPTGQ